MTVVFDAEPLLAFMLDEQGADTVERWLDRVYDGEVAGYITTINLAEFRYVVTRKASVERADTHIDNLRAMGLTEYNIDALWEDVSHIKAMYSPPLGDAYALAAANALDSGGAGHVTLLVGAEDDYDVFEDDDQFSHLIERFRDKPA